MRTMILAAVLAVVALGLSLTTAAALYDVSGSSGPRTFATGAFPPGTPTASPTATSSPPATPTATATPTIEPCTENDDARLALRPDKINLHGTGPFSTSIILANHGHTSTARAVVLGLEAADPVELVDRVAFANGQVWDVHGGGQATLYLVGDLPPGESVEIPLMVSMRPAWEDPDSAAQVEIRVDIAFAGCVKKPSKAMTINLQQSPDDAHRDAREGGSSSATTATADTPTPTGTAEPAFTATATPTLGPTDEATVALLPSTMATAAPVGTATATDTPTPVPMA